MTLGLEWDEMRGIYSRKFIRNAQAIKLGALPAELTVSELLEQWEHQDFEDCIPPWHRINLWRRRAYWERDYVFRF